MTTDRPAMKALYRSDTLTAWVNQGAPDPDTPPALVTFEGIGLAISRNTGKYFGAPLAEKLGLNIIHVVPRAAEWYHYADMDACLAELRRHVGPDTLAYGSSMGGYGVAHFADRLGVRRGICFSPQISIQRSVVPFEKRWQTEAARIDFLHDDTIVPRNSLLWIFTDTAFPEELEHARMIAATGPCHVVPVRHAGHPVGTALKEIGALAPIMAAFLEGREDPDRFAALIGDKVETSVTGLLQKAQMARGRDRERLLRAAVKTYPDSRQARFRLGLTMLQNGKVDKGQQLLKPLLRKPTPKMAKSYRRVCNRFGIDPLLLDES